LSLFVKVSPGVKVAGDYKRFKDVWWCTDLYFTQHVWYIQDSSAGS